MPRPEAQGLGLLRLELVPLVDHRDRPQRLRLVAEDQVRDVGRDLQARQGGDAGTAEVMQPPFGRWHDRKRMKLRGKPHKLVIVVIAQRLVTIANAVLKTGLPWRISSAA